MARDGPVAARHGGIAGDESRYLGEHIRVVGRRQLAAECHQSRPPGGTVSYTPLTMTTICSV